MANEFIVRKGIISMGGVTVPHVKVTSSYNIGDNDYLIECSGSFPVELPNAIGISGKIYVIKNTNIGNITVTTTSSQTIDGSATRTLTPNQSLYIQSNGENWLITGPSGNNTLEEGRNILIQDNKINVDIPPAETIETIIAPSLPFLGQNAKNMIIDDEWNIYYEDHSAFSIRKITPNGVVTELGSLPPYPKGLVRDSAGNFYTANSYSSGVTKTTPEGVSTLFANTGNSPAHIAIDDDDNLYTANRSSNNVTKITPSGESSILGTTGDTPFYIEDGGSNIYVISQFDNNITKITQGGVSEEIYYRATGINTIKYIDGLIYIGGYDAIVVIDEYGNVQKEIPVNNRVDSFLVNEENIFVAILDNGFQIINGEELIPYSPETSVQTGIKDEVLFYLSGSERNLIRIDPDKRILLALDKSDNIIRISKDNVLIKEIKKITATTYTLLEEDNNKILNFTSATDVTITVPAGLPVGNRYEGKQRGDGQLIFVGDTGVTVNVGASETNKTLEKFSVWGLDCCDTDEYFLYGNLELTTVPSGGIQSVTGPDVDDTDPDNPIIKRTEHTGDVTGTKELTIANKAVTNAKMADMPYGGLKGAPFAVGGPVEDISFDVIIPFFASILDLDDFQNATSDKFARMSDVGQGGAGDMMKSIYDPDNKNTNAFDYNNLDNKPTIPNVTGKEDKSNKATNLNSPNDTKYPTTKAVADAIQASGGGDMMKSTYDPNNKGTDAFDYNNLDNKPTIPNVTGKEDVANKVQNFNNPTSSKYISTQGILNSLPLIDLDIFKNATSDKFARISDTKPRTIIQTTNLLFSDDINGAVVIHDDITFTVNKAVIDSLDSNFQAAFNNDTDEEADINIVMVLANEFEVRVNSTIITDSETVKVEPYGTWMAIVRGDKLILNGDLI